MTRGGARVLIGIPTKNRDAFLGKTLASLLEQSYQRFDLLIMQDGDQEVGSTPMTRLMLDCHARAREVYKWDGERRGPPWNHNIALYDPRFAHYEFIARKDDDLPWDKWCLAQLMSTICRSPIIAAVGGLWFEEEPGKDMYDRKIFYNRMEFDISLYINPMVGVYNSNWAQRVYHPTNQLYRVEHIYSDCLYRAEAMREVGGWPEIFTRQVSHCEETHGTFRLHQAGYGLYINPKAHGQHWRAPGGIRTTSEELHAKQNQDVIRWQACLPELRDMHFEPTVVVECKHQHGIGGAARLFYEMVHLLQSKLGHERVAPFFSGLHYSPAECLENFGFRYEETPVPEFADVGIVIGHEPTYSIQARHLLYYCLFPKDYMNKDEMLAIGDYDAVIGISKYTCNWVTVRHDVEADVLYPPVAQLGCSETTVKENMILVVGRCVPHKAPLWLMRRFIELDLGDYELHVVIAMSMVDFRDYEDSVHKLAAEHGNIVLHEDIPSEELNDLYDRAKVLWVGSGMLAEESPAMAEHFGYTPIEAWGGGCVPIVYDRGGFQETVDECLRWTTPEELFEITRHVLGDWEVEFHGGASLFDGVKWFRPVENERFLPGLYAEYWHQWIARAHAGTLQLQHIEHPEVIDRPIRVAMISDSPYLPEYSMGVTSGFGQVAGQMARAFLEVGFDLSVYGLYDHSTPKHSDDLPYDFWLGALDLSGAKLIPAYVQWAEPDVVFMLHAPGELWRWAEQLNHMDMRCLRIAYFPIEGARRLNAAVPRLIDNVDFPVTYCNAGAELVRRAVNKDVSVAYHGADHAGFEPYSAERRQEFRELVGWQDKFVIMTVGTNKRVKNHPIMIEVMRLLLEWGHADVEIYLHTKPYDQFTLQGWSLSNIIDLDTQSSGLPIIEHIHFPQDYNKWQGVDYTGVDVEAWRYAAPSDEYRKAMLNNLDLVTRYNLADLYVDVSSAEGWGMPVLEAVACGVPTVSVDDEMARSEVHSKYCHMLKPAYWDTWHTGTFLALVDPMDVAKKIVELKENSELRFKYAEAGSHVREDLPWKTTTDFFVDLVRKGYAISRGV